MLERVVLVVANMLAVASVAAVRAPPTSPRMKSCAGVGLRKALVASFDNHRSKATVIMVELSGAEQPRGAPFLPSASESLPYL